MKALALSSLAVAVFCMVNTYQTARRADQTQQILDETRGILQRYQELLDESLQREQHVRGLAWEVFKNYHNKQE